MQGKKNTDKWFPVILVDETDRETPETGVVFGDVTCKYYFEGATSLSTYSVTTDDWKEAGEGCYSLNIGASEFTSEGLYEVIISVSGSAIYRFWVDVCDRTMQEFIDEVDGMQGTDGKCIITTDAQALGGSLEVDAARISGSAAAANAVEANIGNLDDAITDVMTAISNVSSAVAALNDISAADVNAEMLDVLATDTHTELVSLPGASPTILEMLQTAATILRNKMVQTSGGSTLYMNDGTTALATRTDSASTSSATRGRLS